MVFGRSGPAAAVAGSAVATPPSGSGGGGADDRIIGESGRARCSGGAPHDSSGGGRRDPPGPAACHRGQARLRGTRRPDDRVLCFPQSRRTHDGARCRLPGVEMIPRLSCVRRCMPAPGPTSRPRMDVLGAASGSGATTAERRSAAARRLVASTGRAALRGRRGDGRACTRAPPPHAVADAPGPLAVASV